MLTFRRLIVRSLSYHWRSNVAVALGVVVGAAVLTGALLVGDSLRGSLRARVERQLAGIYSAALFYRPIPADIANQLSDQEHPRAVAPVLMLPGSIELQPASVGSALAGAGPGGPFLGHITVLGVDERFKPSGTGNLVDWNGNEKKVVLSDRVARKLGASVGDRVKLGVERFSDIPRSSSLSRRGTADVLATDTFTVAAILPSSEAKNDFGLQPNPSAPLNVFVPIRSLSRLALGDTEPRANALLADNTSIDSLNAALRANLKAEDYGLKFRDIDRRNYLSVESANLVLSPTTVAAIQASAHELGVRSEPTVIYIADSLSFDSKEIAYPVIAGLNPSATEPLGPFLPKEVATLNDDEIVLLEWTGSPLNFGLPVGSKIDMAYFDPEVEGEGKLKHAELTLRGYIPLAGAARDRDLTPEVRGVTDVRAELRDLDRPPVLPKATIQERVPDKSPRRSSSTSTRRRRWPT